MRRAAALRLVSGGVLSTSVLAACGKLECYGYAVPASAGSSLLPTRFGCQLYEVDDLERALGLIAGSGGTIVRIGLNGDLAFSDAVCAAASRQNLRVILLTEAVAQPVDIQAFAQHCAALQQHYVQYNPIWEIWNEPNLASYWGTTPDVDAYSRLAIETAKALHGAGAHDVWSGGISGIDLSWIDRMKSNGVFDVMNGCAVHSYQTPACGGYSEYLKLYNAAPAGVQFHTTETCIPSNRGDQADFLRQMWYIHRVLGIPTMIWCELRDGTAGTSGAYALPYGLVDANYAPKEAYLVARDLIAPTVAQHDA